ncbi:MAG: WD40 repeat domain-containing protein [Candidatus Hodarchaeota archaeon]
MWLLKFKDKDFKFKEERILKGHKQAVTALLFSPRNEFLISGDDSGSINIWKFITGDKIHSFKEHNGPVFQLENCVQDGKFISVSGEKLVIWRISTWEPIMRIEIPDNDLIHSIAPHPDGDRVVINTSSRILIGSISNGELRPSTISITPNSNSLCLPDQKTLAVANEENGVMLFDLDNGDKIRDLIKHPKIYKITLVESFVPEFIFRPGFNPIRIISCLQSSIDIVVWEEKSRYPNKYYKLHLGVIYSLIPTPSGNKYVSLSKDRKIKIWDLIMPGPNPQVLQEIFLGDDEGKCLALSNYALHLAVGMTDGYIKIWDNKADFLSWDFGGSFEIKSIDKKFFIYLGEKFIGECLSIKFDATLRDIRSHSRENEYKDELNNFLKRNIHLEILRKKTLTSDIFEGILVDADFSPDWQYFFDDEVKHFLNQVEEKEPFLEKNWYGWLKGTVNSYEMSYQEEKELDIFDNSGTDPDPVVYDYIISPYKVMYELINHPNLPNDIMEKICDIDNICIHFMLLGRPNLPTIVLYKLSKHKDYHIRIIVALLPNLPKVIIEHLLSDKNQAVSNKVKQRPDL